MSYLGWWYYVGRFVPSEDYPGWVVLEQPRNYGITPAVSDPLSLDDVELAAARAAFWSVGDKNFETALRNWGVHFYYPEGFVQFRESTDVCKRLAASLLEIPGVRLLDNLGEFVTWERIFGKSST